MNDSNRIPPVPSPVALNQGHTTGVEGSAALTEDGLDIRRYMSLSPLEQLERLEADGRRLNAEEVARREAEAELKAAQRSKP